MSEGGESISLKEHFTVLVRNLQDEMDRRFKAAEDVAKERQDSNNHRIEAGNKFRESLADREKTFVTRTEFDRLRDDVTGNKAQTAVNTAVIALAVSLVVGVLIVVVAKILGVAP